MANERVVVAGFSISKNLFDFVNQEVLPKTDIQSSPFWIGVRNIIADLATENRDLLQTRDDLQAKIDLWHRTHRGHHNDLAAYKSFLYEIGYLKPRTDADNFQITTTNVDKEIAMQAGPQLVVPLMNARFTLNAANARWGSLYDALYGTDVIPEKDGCERTKEYNKRRGDKVIAFTRQFLDDTVPLTNGLSHSNAKQYLVETGELQVKHIHLFYQQYFVGLYRLFYLMARSLDCDLRNNFLVIKVMLINRKRSCLCIIVFILKFKLIQPKVEMIQLESKMFLLNQL